MPPDETRRLLTREHERFRASFDQAALGVAHIDLAGRILRVNQRLCALHGYPQDQLVGKLVSELELEHGRPAASTAQVQDLLAGRIDSYRAERCFVRPDKAVWHGRVSVSLVRGTTEC